jgi:SCF-associated factor 1
MAEKEKEKVTTRLTELPLDILVLIFPFLDAKTFLALSSTCKAFHQPSIRLDPKYWRHATRSTFRVPNQPLVEHDGVRWQKMYRRMLTQSRVYAWGNDSHSQLALKHRARMEGSFPAEMECPQELGVIADLQCG